MDLVAIGAHPDDVELFASGFLAHSVRRGHDVGIIHLTRGESATRGTPEERRAEALDAATALGIPHDHIAFLDLGDAVLENNEANRYALIEALRRWQPKIILYQHPSDRHPDHGKASRLVDDVCFYCHLTSIHTDAPPFRPQAQLQYFGSVLPAERPAFVVDITETFEQKLAAIRAYGSQFHNPDYDGHGSEEDTAISSREFLEQVEVRARHFGSLIGVRYGEGFRAPAPLALPDPIQTLLSH